MAEVAEKHPSLPANYVSLVQLQERWLKEQQRKRREKEVEERKQRENEGEEELKREKKEKNTASSSVFNNRRPFRRNWNGEESQSEIVKSKKQIGNGERKTASNSVSNNPGSFYRNRNSEELQIENVGEKVEEESEKNQKQIVNGERRVVSNYVSNNRRSFNRKPEESKSENVRVRDEQIDGESKKKTKSRKKNKREKEEEELEREKEKEKKQNNRRPFRWNRNPEELQIEIVGEKVEEECGENQKQIVNGERKIVSIIRNLKPEGSQSENVRVQGELIVGESKKKKKWKKNKRKPKMQENLTGGNQLEEKNPVAVSEGKEAEKKIPVVVSEGDSKMVAIRVEYRPKSYNHRPVNQTVEIGWKFDDLPLKEGNARSQRKSYNHRLVNQTVEIGQKFDDLSLKEGNVRSQRRYNRDSGRFGRPRMEKLREGGQMWVIKGERIDTDATGAGAGNQAQVYC